MEEERTAWFEKLDEFMQRYIHTASPAEMRELARAWLFFLGWEFRKNAGAETLIEMLLVDDMNKTRTLAATAIPWRNAK